MRRDFLEAGERVEMSDDKDDVCGEAEMVLMVVALVLGSELARLEVDENEGRNEEVGIAFGGPQLMEREGVERQ